MKHLHVSLCVQVKGMQEELTALEPELKQKSKETEELLQRLSVDKERANQVRKTTSNPFLFSLFTGHIIH